jgi:lysophospholipase L1-like esterase
VSVEQPSKGRLLIRLAALWPLAFAAFGWLMAFDLGLFAADAARWQKVLVVGLTAGFVLLALGVNDWLQLVRPEVENDTAQRFLSRTDIVYAGVFALAAAGYAFVSLVGPTEFRALPYFAALAAFVAGRANLSVAKTESPKPPERMESYASKIPDHLKGDPREREDGK